MKAPAPRALHAVERRQAILDLLAQQVLVTFRELEQRVQASPATLRRDLDHLEREGRIERLHGGARLVGHGAPATTAGSASAAAQGQLLGTPFRENVARHAAEKRAIGRAAARLCEAGEGIMIDGGSTTLQMCPHLEGLQLQVLTTSLHIVNALLPQANTQVLVPGGAVFREQDIILSATGDDLMPRFHAPKLFMGAASVGPQGLMQDDVVLVAAERRLIERAEQVILLVDSSKFEAPSGNVVCGLEAIDIVVTDDAIAPQHRKMLEQAGVRVLIA
ncbi:MAG: hypothetical protein RL026_1581 [Pseudomonadota bacterium]|jgi:DeoR family ulaG and ulaABCDEF operon transcriptional repressor